MFAKRFFYISAALFLLALTYHLGARGANAQAPGNPVVALSLDRGGVLVAVTTNGDVYGAHDQLGLTWSYRGNVFGVPTATSSTTWGKVKADYRK